MGCVVFHYDMVGYADSVQISHRPGSRPQMNTPENWGYFSPQAELHLQNMMGLQIWNSIRVLDWFSELPDVDPQRIGVTGASGGGTQTFILCAVDPRPLVAFPAVMVSTAMQGGCTCENACYLRIGTSNVEFAALFAPKALGLTCADDWTKEVPTKGFPELQQLFRWYGAEDRLHLAAFLNHPHNYNYHSRLVMYRWMNRHLGLGLEEPLDERPFQPLSREEMTVWTEGHPKPPSGDDYEPGASSAGSPRTVAGRSGAYSRRCRGSCRIPPGNRRRAGGIMLGRRQPVPQEVEVEPPVRALDAGVHLVRGNRPQCTPWGGSSSLCLDSAGYLLCRDSRGLGKPAGQAEFCWIRQASRGRLFASCLKLAGVL